MSLENIRKRSKEVAHIIASVAKPRKAHPRDAAQLELALKALPTPESYAAFHQEVQETVTQWITEIRDRQGAAFGAELRLFLDGLRTAGAAVEESGSGWRVDDLELDTNPQAARARVLYNKEEVVGWQDIVAAPDFTKLIGTARKRLEAYAIPTGELPDLLWEAYRARRSGSVTSRVKLRDLFEELRIGLVRRDIRGAVHKRLRFAEFPRWAAIYNMNVYLTIRNEVPRERQLIPETGNQADVQRGLGFLLGGTDPRQTPTNYCYVHAA